jgi:hypothetical protein
LIKKGLLIGVLSITVIIIIGLAGIGATNIGNIVTQNIIPAQNHQYSIGTPNQIYKNGYFDNIFINGKDLQKAFTIKSINGLNITITGGTFQNIGERRSIQYNKVEDTTIQLPDNNPELVVVLDCESLAITINPITANNIDLVYLSTSHGKIILDNVISIPDLYVYYPAGVEGRAAMAYQGEYTSNGIYSTGDVVMYIGKLYLLYVNAGGKMPVPTDTAWWKSLN